MDAPDVVVCRKCGTLALGYQAEAMGWLVVEHPAGSGRFLIACPTHITSHLRRLVGLPGRESLKLVEKFIDRGLEFEDVEGWAWVAYRREHGALVLEGKRGDESSVRCFTSLPALGLAMQRIGSLRRWKV